MNVKKEEKKKKQRKRRVEEGRKPSRRMGRIIFSIGSFYVRSTGSFKMPVMHF